MVVEEAGFGECVKADVLMVELRYASLVHLQTP